MFATRYWGTKNPIGECVRAGSDSLPCAEIIGVAENVRRQSIFEDSTGSVYLPMAQARGFLSSRQLLARVDRGNPAALTESVRLAMQTAAPQLPYADVWLLANDPTVRADLRPFRLGAAMFGAFGLLAIALAAVGIYGVVSYNVGQRTRDMGVRIALGAPGANVAGLVLREGLVVGLIGIVIGSGIVLLGAKFVQPLLYDEAPRDPMVILSVAVVLIVTACVACLVPAWRAVKTDPITALRAE
jgi:ABC-type antimicrobial peptide transport system permease subunit